MMSKSQKFMKTYMIRMALTALSLGLTTHFQSGPLSQPVALPFSFTPLLYR